MGSHPEYIVIEADGNENCLDENSEAIKNSEIIVNISSALQAANSSPEIDWSTSLRPDTTTNSSPCLLPCSNFPGAHDFEIYFEPQRIELKKVGWTYSSEIDKLYVAKDVACPINFVTYSPPPAGSKIRVLTVFAQPEHANEVVRRCINHSFMDLHNGVSHPDHLIRCECDQAVYETDSVTDRRSVVLPYKHPPMGQAFSTYLFKFLCYGSCAGGLNRRPIRVIFTLESKNEVIGRRALDVKICACPVRDANHENKQVQQVLIKKSVESTNNVSLKKRKRETASDSDSDGEVSSQDSQGQPKKKGFRSNSPALALEILQFVSKITGSSSPTPASPCSSSSPSSKKSSKTASKDGSYTITVYDVEEYEFLKQAKKLYELVQTLQSLSPEIIRYLKSIQKSKKNLESDK